MATDIHTSRACWHVQPTPGDVLEPVILAAHSGCASVQDYLTPDEARQIAAALVAVADEAEAKGAVDVPA